MNGKIAGVGGVFLVCVGIGAWLLRSSGTDPQQAADPLAKRVDRSALAHPDPLPVPVGQEQARQAEPVKPGTGDANGAGATSGAKPAPANRRASAREMEFIAKLFAPPGADATDLERQAWDESPVSDLLYPQGHPCAGDIRDNVSLDGLIAAGKVPLGPVLDAVPEVDTRQCVHPGNWPFHPLNQFCSGVNRQDPASVETCRNFLLTSVQDPKAYPATIWLPCPSPGHPDETTMRAYYEALLAQQAEEIFSRPRCQVN